MNFDLTVRVEKKKEIFWNMIGSIANASTTVILLIATTQIVGDKAAGVFSLAIANAQLLITLGNFGIRPYQATDLNEKFGFDVYFTHRIITCVLMILAGFIYCFANQVNGEKFAAIILFTILKMIDAFADVFEGYMQQVDRLDLAGFALFFRTFSYSAAYSVTLFITNNILISAIMAIGTAISCVFVMLFLPVVRQKHIKISQDKFLLWELTKECFPLFLVLFLMMYLVNAPKYAIDRVMTAEYQAYYNIIYMPAQVINLLSAFAFKPLLTIIKRYWEEKKHKNFVRTVVILVLWISAITVAAVFMASLCAIPILEFVYGTNLKGFGKALNIILIGGGFNAVSYLLYYTLTAIRCQKYVLFCYGITAVIGMGLSDKMVDLYGIEGAACSFLILMFIVCSLMIFGFIYYVNRIKKLM